MKLFMSFKKWKTNDSICLGVQLLFESSTGFGHSNGLSFN